MGKHDGGKMMIPPDGPLADEEEMIEAMIDEDLMTEEMLDDMSMSDDDPIVTTHMPNVTQAEADMSGESNNTGIMSRGYGYWG